MIRSTLLELFLKRNFDPEYLTLDRSTYLSIYLKDKNRIFGRLVQFEGLTSIIEDTNNNRHRVLFDDINFIRRGNR